MYGKRALIPAIILALVIPSYAVAPSVTSVQAHQWQDSSRKVQIDYTLTDPDSATVYVSVAISNDGGSTYSITPAHVTGDTGWVRPGGTRRIVWDAKADYPTAVWTSCRAKITADDTSGGVYPGQMVYIPAGSFLMGNNGDEPYIYDNELPQHSVYLSGYWIGKYEVTRGEYRKFMQAGGYTNPVWWSSAGWIWRVSDNCTQPWYYWADRVCFHHIEGYCNPATCSEAFTQTESHPVVGVSYYEAEAYCNWAGGHLATEAQWEKAARWNAAATPPYQPRTYPWGDTWDDEKCNNYYDHNPAGGGYQRYQTAPVGSYPTGMSPYGCHDMAGNVWEWVQDWYKSYAGSTSPFDYTGSFRVLRGGGWFDGDYNARCAYRSCDTPYYWYWYYGLGFRLVR